MNHVTLARKLMAVEDAASLRYAALELRMAIERLFYSLLPSYREELPDDLMKVWQPKKIIDALIDCDPYVEQDYTVSIASELPNGGHGPVSRIGRYKAVDRKLLRQYYHKIGSFLHAPMRHEHKNLTKMQSFLNSAAQRIEEYCLETTIVSNFGVFHTVTCVCGRTIKRNAQAVQKRPYIICPDEKCRAVFDLLNIDENNAVWKLRETKIVCPCCNTSNFVGTHLIADEARVACVECHKRYVIGSALFLRPEQG
jgi:hypothetical protein